MWNIRSIRTADKRVLYFQMEWNLFQSYIMDIRNIKHSTVDLWTCTIYLDLDGAISLKQTHSKQKHPLPIPILNPIICHSLVKGKIALCGCELILDVVEMLKQYKGNYPFHHPISYKYYFTKYCLTFSVWLSFLLSKQHHNNCYLDIFSRYIYCTTLSSAAWLHSSLHCCSIATCGLLCPGCHCRHQHRWATVDSRMGTGKLRSWVAPPSHRVPQFR